MDAAVVSAIVGSCTTAVLLWIGTLIRKLIRQLRQNRREHDWLMMTTAKSVRQIERIMRHLDMTEDS